VSIVYLVLPLALVLVLAAVVAFVWAARGGQFDDLHTPALRVMHDDELVRPRPARPLGAANSLPPPPGFPAHTGATEGTPQGDTTGHSAGGAEGDPAATHG
jgi:cbb3-type cytochrome oxidase maturation protein